MNKPSKKEVFSVQLINDEPNLLNLFTEEEKNFLKNAFAYLSTK